MKILLVVICMISLNCIAQSSSSKSDTVYYGVDIRSDSLKVLVDELFPHLSDSTNHMIIDSGIYEIEEVRPNEPEYPGGLVAMSNFLATKIIYPDTSLAMGNEGVVYVRFVVETDGSISNVKTIRGVDPFIDKVAENAVKMMPNWTPSCDKEICYRVKFILPITFKMSGW